MNYNYSWHKNYWHIMIPVGCIYNEKQVIASCTDSSIIKKPVPGNLSRHVEIIYEPYNSILDNFEIKFEYSSICKDCIKLHDKDKIKFDIIVNKLKN